MILDPIILMDERGKRSIIIISIIIIAVIITQSAQKIDFSEPMSTDDPIPFITPSNTLHLLSRHLITKSDMLSRSTYHQRKVSDNSWSTPKKIAEELSDSIMTSDASIRYIKTNENGFTLYFSWEDQYKHQGLYKQTYNEFLDQWSDIEVVLSLHDIYDLLGIPFSEEYYEEGSFDKYLPSEPGVHRIYWEFIKYLKYSNGSYVLTWLVEYYEGDKSIDHNDSIIVTTYNTEGKVISYMIVKFSTLGLTMRSNIDSIFPINDTFVLYFNRYRKRAIFEGNQTSIEETGYGCPSYCHSIITENLFLRVIPDSDMLLIFDLIDFNYQQEVSFPIHIEYMFDEHLHLTLVNQSISFVYFDGIEIQLWEYKLYGQSWEMIDAFEHHPNFESKSHEPNSFKFIREGEDWFIFWSQGTSESGNPSEIFMISYDGLEWDDIKQITQEDNFSDDYERGLPYPIGMALVPLIVYYLVINKRQLKFL